MPVPTAVPSVFVRVSSDMVAHPTSSVTTSNKPITFPSIDLLLCHGYGHDHCQPLGETIPQSFSRSVFHWAKSPSGRFRYCSRCFLTAILSTLISFTVPVLVNSLRYWVKACSLESVSNLDNWSKHCVYSRSVFSIFSSRLSRFFCISPTVAVLTPEFLATWSAFRTGVSPFNALAIYSPRVVAILAQASA